MIRTLILLLLSTPAMCQPGWYLRGDTLRYSDGNGNLVQINKTGLYPTKTELKDSLDIVRNSVALKATTATTDSMRTNIYGALNGKQATITNGSISNAMLANGAVANLSGTNTGDQTISDATISTTDITTNNATTSKHGFMPKGDNNALHFYASDGTQKTPTGVNSTITFLGADVTNNNASANTIADVTGLSFSVTSGTTYRFKFFVVYTSAATTTGSRWAINGPAATFVNYNSTYTLTATSVTTNSGTSAYDIPAASNASSLSSGNIAIVEGIIKPSANGTVILRFASEISGSAIVAKANQSYVEYQAIN